MLTNILLESIIDSKFQNKNWSAAMGATKEILLDSGNSIKFLTSAADIRRPITSRGVTDLFLTQK